MPPAAPEFWSRPSFLAPLLQPLAWGHAAASAARYALAHPWRAAVPVLCVGNLVAGGAGKTPVAIDLARRLARSGHRPHLLSRGYGGSLAGPVAVDPTRHDAGQVGDEPLLLAAAAPAWIARDRVAGARAAIAAGADALILDDGFQNPSIEKNLSLVVVDGGYGFGNGRVLPAGPLREPIRRGLLRADAVVLMGEDEAGVRARLGGTPLLRARLEAQAGERFRGQRIVAFAGIARPRKFFATLEGLGAQVIARHAFPDHHAYGGQEIDRLAAAADAQNARLVTTEKDAARLAAPWRARVETLAVAVAWEDEAALAALLDRLFAERRHG